jgi:hypothetical protein
MGNFALFTVASFRGSIDTAEMRKEATLGGGWVQFEWNLRGILLQESIVN